MATELPGNGSERPDRDGRTPNGETWKRRRSYALRVLVVCTVAAFLLYAQSGRNLPFLGNPRGGNIPSAAGDVTYFSLESQGIELGPLGGSSAKVGEPAPDFALRDLNGKVVRLSEFRGDTIVVNFWATWCPPCRQEFPELVTYYERYKDRGLVIVAVNLQESRHSAAKFASDFEATFPIVLDTEGSVAWQYRILGLPTTWFIDGEGIVRSQVIGLLTPDLLKKNLEEADFQTTAAR